MAEPETVNQVAIESDSDYMHVDSTPTTSDKDEDVQTTTVNNCKNTAFRSSMFEEIDEKKLALRANRFGTDITLAKSRVPESELNALYKSLGIDYSDSSVLRNGRIRLNAIHLRGVDSMNTQQVLDYFKDYSPDLVEWINDQSCNVVWSDSSLTARALLDLSRPVKKNLKNNSIKEDASAGSEVEEGEDVEMTEQESEEQRIRHISSDSDIQQTRYRRSSSEQSGTPVPNNSPVDTSQIDDVSSGNEVDSSKIEIPMPPGNWRLGVEVENAKALLLRFAYRSDRKQPGAEKLSQYYMKYGNPNYKGLKGIISTSFKNKVHDGRKRPHYVDLDAPVDDDQPFKPIPVEDDPVLQEQTKRPRMRMYADEEEEKQKSRTTSVPSLHPADLRNRIVHEKSPSSASKASLDDLRSRLPSRQPWNITDEDESFDQELADVQSLLTPRSLSMPIVMGDLRNKLEKLRQAKQPKVPLLIEVSQDDA